jgi:hypothetical protein
MKGKMVINGSTEDGYGTTSSINKTAVVMLTGAATSPDQDVDSREFHAFAFFDTSDIPVGAKVVRVELQLYVSALTGNMGQQHVDVYIGDNTAGSTLTTADYNATVNNGQLLQRLTGKGLSTGYVTAASTNETVCAEVSKTATTNIEIDTVWTGPASSSYCIMYTQEYTTTAYRPQLTVWYVLEDPKIF